jgi:uncharacterized membrane protein YeaQ/YmgE (transglycosylase-associated protein family)
MFNLIRILFIGRAIGRYAPCQHAGYLMSILGAIVLLALYRFAIRRRTA